MTAATVGMIASCAAAPPRNDPVSASGEASHGLAPLTLPPNYSLHPGDKGEEAVDQRTVAKRILGQRWSRIRAGSPREDGARPGGLSAEEVLRRELRLDGALPEIRQLLAEESGTGILRGNYPVQALLCWPRDPATDGCRSRDGSQERASVDDPEAETPALLIERVGAAGDALF